MKKTKSYKAIDQTIDNNSKKVLFIGDSSIFSRVAFFVTKNAFFQTTGVFRESGDLSTPNLEQWSGDYILSFKSDLILSLDILNKAKIACLNFHPGPPNYRGRGTYYWAIKNREQTYGVTCHHMVEKVDRGKIIAVNYFPILRSDTPESLKYRSGISCLALLNNILSLLATSGRLPESNEYWSGKLYKEHILQDPNKQSTNNSGATYRQGK